VLGNKPEQPSFLLPLTDAISISSFNSTISVCAVHEDASATSFLTGFYFGPV
jgi:hypothetical protein